MKRPSSPYASSLETLLKARHHLLLGSLQENTAVST